MKNFDIAKNAFLSNVSEILFRQNFPFERNVHDLISSGRSCNFGDMANSYKFSFYRETLPGTFVRLQSVPGVLYKHVVDYNRPVQKAAVMYHVERPYCIVEWGLSGEGFKPFLQVTAASLGYIFPLLKRSEFADNADLFAQTLTFSCRQKCSIVTVSWDSSISLSSETIRRSARSFRNRVFYPG